MEIMTPGGIKIDMPSDETIHRLWIVHPKTPTHEIVERDCRIVVTEKMTWAEPLMPLRGSARDQKRFMLGAFAFYTRKQAERKKLIQLLALAKAKYVHQASKLAYDAEQQLEHYKSTGEVL